MAAWAIQRPQDLAPAHMCTGREICYSDRTCLPLSKLSISHVHPLRGKLICCYCRSRVLLLSLPPFLSPCLVRSLSPCSVTQYHDPNLQCLTYIAERSETRSARGRLWRQSVIRWASVPGGFLNTWGGFTGSQEQLRVSLSPPPLFSASHS